MHRILLLFVLCFFFSSVSAQKSLTGVTFANSNIMAEELGKIDSQIVSARKDTIAKAQKEKGRELTAKELEEIDKKIAEAQKLAKAMQRGMIIGISVTFTSDTEAEMRTKIQIDEEVLKAAGIGWMKRKALKLALKAMPEKVKEKYSLHDNLIIFSPKKEPDTLRISSDFNSLSGKFDHSTPFILHRQ